ncbi:MAG: protoporphyrinogen oxidase [Oligoflexales bacterium]|nr:protoporphyrinogen oxidase [Oligoflexales bacterium]
MANDFHEYIIIGGGLAGLSALETVVKRTKNVLCLEKDMKCGGLVKSHKHDPYLLETGPNAFLKSYEHTYNFISSIGLEEQIINNRPNTNHRFVAKNNSLFPIPENPFSFIMSPLFSMKAKLRFCLEPLIPPGDKIEESLYDFGRRRFGGEITRTVLDAMVNGICTGDVKKIDVTSLFPKISNIEKEYHSFLMFLLKFKRKNTLKSNQGHRYLFSSLKEGMGQISDTVHKRHRDKIRTNSSVTSIEWSNEFYHIKTNKESYSTKNLIIGTPAHVASKLLDKVDMELSNELNKIPYTNVVTITFGFKENDLKHPLNGFGHLIPNNQGHQTLGTLYCSSLFEGRSPKGHKLIKVYLGGVHRPKLIEKTDKELIDIALKDTSTFLQSSHPPIFSNINRIHNAIPQYNLGHQSIKGKVKDYVSRNRGLFLVGNYLDGISVNEAIKSGLGIFES